MWRDVGGAGKVTTWVSAEPVEPWFITYLPTQVVQQLVVEGGPPTADPPQVTCTKLEDATASALCP